MAAPYNSFPDDVILSIAQSDNGKLWLGTYQGGLLSYDSGKFSSHRLDHDNKDSYANKNVFVIVLDSSAYNGIAQIALNDGNFVMASVIYVHAIDNQQCNPRAIIKAASGKIVLGGVSGVSIFDPINLAYSLRAESLLRA